MNEAQLVKTIKAHIERGDKASDRAEQHYISAGKYLKDLKEQHGGTWAEWEALLKEKMGIGKSRASELMRIADGRKTVEQIRADGAEREAARRERKRLSPSRDGENAGDLTSMLPIVAAALRAVEQMDEDDRDSLFAPRAKGRRVLILDEKSPASCGAVLKVPR